MDELWIIVPEDGPSQKELGGVYVVDDRVVHVNWVYGVLEYHIQAGLAPLAWFISSGPVQRAQASD